eukprot:CAMPEP_0117763578 /NCGR_PEP_ID=MMETSP0947-20121206/18756_1 /TAXON_ID=44440 /ORGANISM="Chattonella subsalsa, Strain CCMP2191" /LENGTH=196 /DNA_ID=CAMNT_0005585381 /DNA_START=40 /DNA_END=631 /DNA_ORIENTATION=+
MKGTENDKGKEGFWKPGETQPMGKKKENAPQGFKKLPNQMRLKGNPLDYCLDIPNKKAKESLSGSTLSLKFMQRKKMKEEAETAERLRAKKEAERRKSIEWTLSNAHGQHAENRLECLSIEPDLSTEDLGRRSFGGFNKIVEQRYTSCLNGKKKSTLSKKAFKQEVSSEEMLQRFERYVGIPSNKAIKKNSNSNPS